MRTAEMVGAAPAVSREYVNVMFAPEALIAEIRLLVTRMAPFL